MRAARNAASHFCSRLKQREEGFRPRREVVTPTACPLGERSIVVGTGIPTVVTTVVPTFT